LSQIQLLNNTIIIRIISVICNSICIDFLFSSCDRIS